MYLLPFSFPSFNAAIIHVVLLPGVEDEFSIVAPVFLHRFKDQIQVIKKVLIVAFTDFQQLSLLVKCYFNIIVHALCMRPKTFSTSRLDWATRARRGSSYPHSNSSTVRVTNKPLFVVFIHVPTIILLKGLVLTLDITA